MPAQGFEGGMVCECLILSVQVCSSGWDADVLRVAAAGQPAQGAFHGIRPGPQPVQSHPAIRDLTGACVTA